MYVHVYTILKLYSSNVLYSLGSSTSSDYWQLSINSWHILHRLWNSSQFWPPSCSIGLHRWSSDLCFTSPFYTYLKRSCRREKLPYFNNFWHCPGLNRTIEASYAQQQTPQPLGSTAGPGALKLDLLELKTQYTRMFQKDWDRICHLRY